MWRMRRGISCVSRARNRRRRRASRSCRSAPTRGVPMREVYQMFKGEHDPGAGDEGGGLRSLGAVLRAAVYRPVSRGDRQSRGRPRADRDRRRRSLCARRRLHARCRARAHEECHNPARMQRRVIALRLRRPLCAQQPVSSPRSRIASTPSRRRRRSWRAYGPHDIGVRTIQVTDKNRPDILNIKEGGPIVRYDRTLTLEVWYPAALAAGQKPGGEYRVITRDPAVMATLYGKAVRDAAVARRRPTPYPARHHLARLSGQSLPDVATSARTSRARASSRSRSITRTAPTTIRRRSAARSTTARSISCSC